MQLTTVRSFLITFSCTPSLPPPALTVPLLHEVITNDLAYSLLSSFTIIGNFCLNNCLNEILLHRYILYIVLVEWISFYIVSFLSTNMLFPMSSQCKHCEKAYRYHSSLWFDERSHTGEKSYVSNVKKLFVVIKAFNHMKDFTPERNPINVNTVRKHSETASLFESMKGLTLERRLISVKKRVKVHEEPIFEKNPQLQLVNLVVACGISFSDQVLNPGPLSWELRVLARGPPGKSQVYSFCFLRVEYLFVLVVNFSLFILQ